MIQLVDHTSLVRLLVMMQRNVHAVCRQTDRPRMSVTFALRICHYLVTDDVTQISSAAD